MSEIKTLTIDGIRYDVVDDGAVRKVTGKGLSTNDYTDTDKAKLDGIDTTQLVTKAVDDLVNYYLKSETYTKAEVQQLIAAVQGVSFVSVATLPTASAETMGGKIYLVPSANPKTQNVKDEYITIEAEGSYSWEQIGSTEADLTGYVTDAELTAALADYTTTASLTALLAAKQDVISDLATIRSGAAAGATAYQKPQTGIPASDLAAGVIPDVSGKQDIYSVPTAQITNPKEGDITRVEEALMAENLQNGQGLISLNSGTTIRIIGNSDAYQSNLENGGKINIYGSISGMFSGLIGSIEVRDTSGFSFMYVIDSSDIAHQINGATSYDLPAKFPYSGYEFTADKISFTEVIETGEHSILPYIKVDSIIPSSVSEYKDGAWVDRKNFPTTFDGLPTDGSNNLIKSGGVAAGIKASAQSYCGVSTEPSSPKEGDVWDSPLVESMTQVSWAGQTPFYMPDSNYQTKITLADGATTVNISVRKSDQTTETLTDPTEFPKIYPAGEVYAVIGSGTGLGSVDNYQPAFKKIYHSGAWVDIDTMFTDVEANPTVPSGTTPTALSGLKVGSSYYSTPDVSGKENTSNKVTSLSAASTDTQYPSAKATYDAINPSVQSSQPAGGMLPNVLYKLGTLTGSVTIAFASPADANIENEYKFTFTADSTAPTITWPAAITKWAGNALDSGLPNVEADTYYEVSVEDGMGIINKFE